MVGTVVEPPLSGACFEIGEDLCAAREGCCIAAAAGAEEVRRCEECSGDVSPRDGDEGASRSDLRYSVLRHSSRCELICAAESSLPHTGHTHAPDSEPPGIVCSFLCSFSVSAA